MPHHNARAKQNIPKRHPKAYTVSVLGCSISLPLLIALSLITLLRILASWWLGNWYLSIAVCDDQLMTEYADLSTHFSDPNRLSLVKTMSYALFLNLPALTGISYNVLVSLLWVAAALCVCFAMWKVNPNKAFVILSYLFVLWAPIAFDAETAGRLYRNALIAPLLFMVFSLMLSILLTLVKNQPRINLSLGLQSILFSGILLFFYYLKEDSFWLMPVLAVFIIGCFIILYLKRNSFFRNISQTILAAAFILLPIVVLQGGSCIYKSLNQTYFGVSEINTRTEGAMGDFVKNIYKIKADERSKYVWAPDDAIRQAFAVSETLQLHPELEENLLHNSWFRTDTVDEMIPGDFLTWVLSTSLRDTNLWSDEATLQDFFEQVNEELEEAFDDGRLQQDESRFFLTSSGGSRSIGEILGLVDDVGACISGHIILSGYDANQEGREDLSDDLSMRKESYLLNQYVGDPPTPGLQRIDRVKERCGMAIANIDFAIYRILNVVLIFGAFIGWLYSMFDIFRTWRARKGNRVDARLIATAFMTILIGIGLVYALGISWFSEFIYREDLMLRPKYLVFYGCGLVPMLSLFMLLGCHLLTKPARNLRRWLEGHRTPATGR